AISLARTGHLGMACRPPCHPAASRRTAALPAAADPRGSPGRRTLAELVGGSKPGLERFPQADGLRWGIPPDPWSGRDSPLGRVFVWVRTLDFRRPGAPAAGSGAPTEANST